MYIIKSLSKQNALLHMNVINKVLTNQLTFISTENYFFLLAVLFLSIL